MKLVVDTNILFSFFKYDSVTKRIISSEKFDLLKISTDIFGV
jgi:hypothetical protein